MKKAIKYLENVLHDNDKVVIAVSGGSDSMCLLDLIMHLNKKINIIVCHVNHKVRKESDEEYLYVQNFCKKNNLIFEGMEITSYSNENFEAEARKKRYEFFENTLNKHQAKYIITAHHGDDEIETILMRISRGSNLPGYIGIKISDGKYLRPLLYVTKDDILKYVKTYDIKYFEDITNYEDIHTRNRYRKEVLPFLKKENKNIHEKYLQFSNELQKYDNFINKYINNIHNLYENGYINIDVLNKEDDFIKERIIINKIKEIQVYDKLPVDNNVLSNIIDLVNSKNNKSIDIANGYEVIKEYNHLIIQKKTEIKSFSKEFSSTFQNELFNINLVKENNSKSNFILRLCSKDIKLPLIIRSKQDGDVISIKGSGTKKVSDIFIDAKIKKEERLLWPVVTDSNNQVLWIPGLKKSKFDKDITEKYDIILTSERKYI